MMQVRKKDKIFLAVVLPLVLLWGYFDFVRKPLVRRFAALQTEQRQLPDEAMFPTEKRQLQKRIADAEAALAQEKAEKPPEMKVAGEPTALAAARQDAVLAALAKAGAKIVRVQPMAGEKTSEDRRGDAVLRSTERCAEPEVRCFTVEADYATFLSALGAFSSARMAVIPESVSLRVGSRTCRWEMVLWL